MSILPYRILVIIRINARPHNSLKPPHRKPITPSNQNSPLLASSQKPSICHDRFRRYSLDHWDRYCDLRLVDESLQSTSYVRDIIQRMLLCRDPEWRYARWVCPGLPA